MNLAKSGHGDDWIHGAVEKGRTFTKASVLDDRDEHGRSLTLSPKENQLGKGAAAVAKRKSVSPDKKKSPLKKQDSDVKPAWNGGSNRRIVNKPTPRSQLDKGSPSIYGKLKGSGAGQATEATQSGVQIGSSRGRSKSPGNKREKIVPSNVVCHITLHRAVNLEAKDADTNTSDPYCKLIPVLRNGEKVSSAVRAPPQTSAKSGGRVRRVILRVGGPQKHTPALSSLVPPPAPRAPAFAAEAHGLFALSSLVPPPAPSLARFRSSWVGPLLTRLSS